MTNPSTPPDERLRSWAKGLYPLEAGVDLLIRHGKAIYTGAPWIHDDGERAWLDVARLLIASGAWSGGEQRIVRLAASLIGDEPVNLADALSGNDRHNTELILAAIAHASGSHQDNDVQFDDDGFPRAFTRLRPLYPWPDPTQHRAAIRPSGPSL